jgi:tripartite tricarboxylate transporter family receptor
MKRICLILLSVLGLTFASVEAGAQAWPTRPIRAIVAFSAGGIVDIIARVVLDQLSIQLRQQVVIENRVGAGTTIAAAFVAKSDPDGYSMLVNSSAHTISPSMHPNLTFDPARDFSAVIPLGNSPNALVVSPSRGFKTVGDLVAAAKAKPGSFNFASAGASLLGGDHERQDCYCVFDNIGPSHGSWHLVHRLCTDSRRPGEDFHGGCGRETDRGHACVHRAFRCVEGPRLQAGRQQGSEMCGAPAGAGTAAPVHTRATCTACHCPVREACAQGTDGRRSCHLTP